MKNFNRRQLLLGSAGALLGLSSGCGSGTSLPASLAGYLVLGTASSRLVIARPDGSDRQTLLNGYSLHSVSPDRKVLALTGASGITLWTKESSVLLQISSIAPLPLAWSPDSQYLLLGRYSEVGRLVLLSTVTREGSVQAIERLPPSSRSVHSAGWLDRQHLTYEGLEGTFRFNLEDGKEEKLSNNRFHTPSPDGRSLLRFSYPGSIGGLLERLDTQTGAVEPLLDGLAFLQEGYRWSSDGQYLLLSGNRGIPLALRIRTSSQTVEEISLSPLSGIAPLVLWSPDSQSFAYQWHEEFGADGDWPTFLEIRGGVGRFTFPEGGYPMAWL